MRKIKTIFTSILFMLVGMAAYAQNDRAFPAFSSSDLKIENKIQIYPNPSVDFLKIKLEKSNLVNPKIIIHSIIGNKLNVFIKKISINEFVVDVKNIPAGYYFLAVKDATTNFSETYKFLKR